MKEPLWISEKEAKAIHDLLITIHGGSPGIRDENLLSASLARPRHIWTYSNPNLFDLGAAYGYGLTKNHPFVDGNKRTAFVVMVTFLEVNGFLVTASETEVVIAMERLACNIITQDALAIWLQENSQEV